MTDSKFKIVTGPIREGAFPIHIYNDGLTVFLYDHSNTDRIKNANPQIIWYAGEESFADPVTQELIATGDLLVYGMFGDGGVDVEVVVGQPLSNEELATGLWYPPQRAKLRLPSGQLLIHSYNTLPMGDNDEDPDDKGAMIEVPPDEYIATLYRKDWDAMEQAGIMNLDWVREDGIDGSDRINDVIVLTPIAEAVPLNRPSDVLFKDCLA